jgi:hypothetical protein
MKNNKRQTAKTKIPSDKSKVMNRAIKVIAMKHSSTDPFGSYTGVCKDVF